MTKFLNFLIITVSIVIIIFTESCNKQHDKNSVVVINQEFIDSIHQYDELFPFHDGLAPVQKNGKMGMINTKGELIIPCKYYIIGPYCEGVFVEINENNQVSIINEKGEELKTKYTIWSTMLGNSSCSYKDFIYFHNGELYLSAEGYDDGVFINKQGEIISNPKGYDNSEYLSEVKESEFDLFYEEKVDLNNDMSFLFGIRDANGKEILPAKYSNISGPSNGVFQICIEIQNAADNDGWSDARDRLTYYGYADINGNTTFTDKDLMRIASNESEQLNKKIGTMRQNIEREHLQKDEYNNQMRSQEIYENQEQNTEEMEIMFKLHQLGERGRDMMPRIEMLYHRQQQAQRQGILSNPEAQFDLSDAIDELINIKTQQIRLAEQLDDAQLVKEYKQQRSQIYKAKDQMLYGIK